MEYREIGKTGLRAGVIGLGCEHLDGKPYPQVKETIDAALENGVNIMDVFMPGTEIRENIARALGDRRKRVMLQGHIGSTDIKSQYDVCRDMPTVKRYFEELLRIFGGYIDFGMLFFIDSEKDYKNVFETGFADYALHLKQRGYIRHIGFSSHNPVTAMKAINTGLPEMMMFSVNPAFDMLPAEEYIIEQLESGIKPELFRGLDPMRAELYKLCKRKRIGITVMKTLGAGKLISAEHTPFEKPLTVSQCVHYALSRPSVASVLLGCGTASEVKDAHRYFELEDSLRDYSEAISGVRNDFWGNCVYCSHCQPCPAGIDIAAVNRCLDVARTDSEASASVRGEYLSLPRRGNVCTGCGSCEERCPFKVPVIDNMAEAESLLGNG